MWNKAFEFIQSCLEAGSPYRGPILAAIAAVAVFAFYRTSKRLLIRYFRRRPAKAENLQNFLFVYRYVWMAVGAILVVASLSGSIAALGISAAFMGLVFGWSLQSPVTGIAAWLMIVIKRPFKIGDRVIIAGVTGDIIDINLTHIVLNQVGGTVAGEERSGRGVMIPNAILFQQVIYNYAFETKYLLDEVPVMISYESDVDEAEQICLRSAEAATAEAIAKTGQQPFARVELADSGVRIRLRYQILATERQMVSSEIVRLVIAGFNESDRVEFAYPHTEVLYRPKTDTPSISPKQPQTP